MPQLVGVPCIFCSHRIESEWEGRFCAVCGCPAHNACMEGRHSEATAGACPGCGAPKDAVPAVRGAPPSTRVSILPPATPAAEEAEEGVAKRAAKARLRWGLKVAAFGGLMCLLCSLRLLLRPTSEGPLNIGQLVDAVIEFIIGVSALVYGFYRIATSENKPTGPVPGRGGAWRRAKSQAELSALGAKDRNDLKPSEKPASRKAILPQHPPGLESGDSPAGTL